MTEHTKKLIDELLSSNEDEIIKISRLDRYYCYRWISIDEHTAIKKQINPKYC